MTNEQINEAIAKAIGGKRDTEYGPLYSSSEGWTCNCPDFCTDLNAMHQAEWTLSDDQLWRMAREIEHNPDRWYFRATARERAEAFLRTLGKWEEVHPC